MTAPALLHAARLCAGEAITAPRPRRRRWLWWAIAYGYAAAVVILVLSGMSCLPVEWLWWIA